MSFFSIETIMNFSENIGLHLEQIDKINKLTGIALVEHSDGENQEEKHTRSFHDVLRSCNKEGNVASPTNQTTDYTCVTHWGNKESYNE